MRKGDGPNTSEALQRPERGVRGDLGFRVLFWRLNKKRQNKRDPTDSGWRLASSKGQEGTVSLSWPWSLMNINSAHYSQVNLPEGLCLILRVRVHIGTRVKYGMRATVL